MNNIKLRMWCKEAKKFFYKPNQVLECLKQKQTGFYPHNELVFQWFSNLLDKNGKEIFEGDIIKWWWNSGEEDDLGFGVDSGGLVLQEKAEIIEFRYGGFGFSTKRSWRFLSSPFYDEVVEVIGNIFENRCLLK